MSADGQAPSLSLNVRYSREDKKNQGQQEDIQEESYEDQETLKLGHADLRSHKVTHRRHFATASILGVLYLLILAGIFMRCIFVTLDHKNLVMEREQLMITLNQTQARIINLTQENDELRIRYSGLKSENDVNKQLRTERDELQTRYDSLSNENSRLKTENTNMRTERDELQTRYDRLSNENSRLKTENTNTKRERVVLQTRYDRLSNENSRLKTENTNMKRERDELQTRSDSVSSQSRSSWSPERDELQTRSDSLSNENSRLKTEKRNTKRERDKIQNTDGRLVSGPHHPAVHGQIIPL